MARITNENLPDMQKSTTGFSKRKINKVGVRGIKMNLPIVTMDGRIQYVVATISSYCNLVENLKGINMSRITRQIIEELNTTMDGIYDLRKFAYRLKEAHGTDDIYVKAQFEYIIPSRSPMSDLESFEPVNVTIESTLQGNTEKSYLTVESTGMSLCPCSKEMSLLTNNLTDDESQEIENLSPALKAKIGMAGFGAHNQNSISTIKVELRKSSKMFIETLAAIASMAMSSPIFGTLKREDEKFVTEVSYTGGYFDDNKTFVPVGMTGPKFVEDIARNVADLLDDYLDILIGDYVVVVNNDESIHPDPLYATAILSAGRKLS